MGDVVGKLIDPIEAAGFAWKSSPELTAEVKVTVAKALAWADDATLAKAAEWIILNRKFRSMPMPADLIGVVKSCAPKNDARADGPLWGEGVRDRIRVARSAHDVDAIWRSAVQPMRGKVDPRIWGFVRWWVHWRMRELPTMRMRVPSGAIADWPEEWWAPLPPQREKSP